MYKFNVFEVKPSIINIIDRRSWVLIGSFYSLEEAQDFIQYKENQERDIEGFNRYLYNLEMTS